MNRIGLWVYKDAATQIVIAWRSSILIGFAFTVASFISVLAGLFIGIDLHEQIEPAISLVAMAMPSIPGMIFETFAFVAILHGSLMLFLLSLRLLILAFLRAANDMGRALFHALVCLIAFLSAVAFLGAVAIPPQLADDEQLGVWATVILCFLTVSCISTLWLLVRYSPRSGRVFDVDTSNAIDVLSF